MRQYSYTRYPASLLQQQASGCCITNKLHPASSTYISMVPSVHQTGVEWSRFILLQLLEWYKGCLFILWKHLEFSLFLSNTNLQVILNIISIKNAIYVLGNCMFDDTQRMPLLRKKWKFEVFPLIKETSFTRVINLVKMSFTVNRKVMRISE